MSCYGGAGLVSEGLRQRTCVDRFLNRKTFAFSRHSDNSKNLWHLQLSATCFCWHSLHCVMVPDRGELGVLQSRLKSSWLYEMQQIADEAIDVVSDGRLVPNMLPFDSHPGPLSMHGESS